VKTVKISRKLSPKILRVKLEARLSRQYHNRRAEIWKIYIDAADIVISGTDVEKEKEVYYEETQIVLKQDEWHRLIGSDDVCVMAEIWQHSDVEHP
jgi:mannose-6-phosphate isomerase